MTQQSNQTPSGRPSSVDPRLTRHGGLSYIVIPAIEARRSAEFYREVLGWNVEGLDTAQPKFLDGSGHLLGRWNTELAVARESGLLPYFYVDDIDDVVARVTAHGGAIVKPPYPEGNLRVATVRDPAGNLIGLWQEAAT